MVPPPPTSGSSEQQLRKQRNAATVLLLQISFALTVMGMASTVTARAEFLLQFSGGDSAAASKLMGVMTSATSVLEFVLGPCLGRMSDKFGRRIFLLIGPMGLLVCDGLGCLLPARATIIAGSIVRGMAITAFITILRGTIGDVVQGQAMALANSQMAIYSGVGVILGPWFCGRFLPGRLAYGFSALCGISTIGYVLTRYQETLALSERKPIKWSACNPFSFVKLFTHSREMTLMVLAVGFQSIGETRFAIDLCLICWRAVHSVPPQRMGNMPAIFGVCSIAAGLIGRTTIRKFGQKGHTSISNIANVLSNLVWAMDTSERGTFIGQSLMSFGHRKRDGVEAMIYKLGTSDRVGRSESWGRGEMSGMLANFKSLTWIIAPILYARAYDMGTRGARTFYGAPMLVASLAAMLSQLCVMAFPSMAHFEQLCTKETKKSLRSS
eukprot:COSAG05_NODE_178_length_14897_cov_619.335248_15_plen_440_part_00